MRSCIAFCQLQPACQPLPGKKPTPSSSRVEERPHENVRVPAWARAPRLALVVYPCGCMVVGWCPRVVGTRERLGLRLRVKHGFPV